MKQRYGAQQRGRNMIEANMRAHLQKRQAKVRYTPGILALGLMLCLMLDAPTVIASMKEGLRLVAHTMIPSLFPFMVAAEVIVRSGAGEQMMRPLCKVIRSLLGLNEAAGSALLLGFLCGFPIGSRMAASYYRAGRLTMRQFVLVVCMCNVPSSAFLVNAVGVCLFGTKKMGWTLVWLSLVAALGVGVLFRFWLPKTGKWNQYHPSMAAEESAGGSLLPASIAAAASGMLQVSATVLLFCSLMGVLSHLCRALLLGGMGQAILAGLLELSTGVCAAAGLGCATLSPVLCAAMVGWAGLSVHCQIFSVCQECPLARGWFYLSRALQAGLCALMMTAWMRVGGLTLPGPMTWRETMAIGFAAAEGFAGVWCGLCGVCFVLACCFGMIRSQRGYRRERA